MARPRKGEVRRGEILAAFEACVVRKGFAETTLADVAEAAGQPRSLVRHFIGNRDEMIEALIDRLLERARMQVAQLPALETVDQVMSMLMERVFDDPTTNIVIMELWHVALRDPEVRDGLAEVYRSFIEWVTEAIAQDPDDAPARDRAFASVSLAFGSAFFRYLGLRPPSDAALHRTARAVLTGASAPGGPS